MTASSDPGHPVAGEGRPFVIYLIGVPAVGKYTVAKEISRLTGARVVDNQLVNIPVFSVLGFDGKDSFPLPSPAWDYIETIRVAVFSAIRELSPPGDSFVFTNVLEAGDARALEQFQRVSDLADARRSGFFPVWLTCDAAAIRSRKASSDREARFKDTDVTNIDRYLNDFQVLSVSHPNALTLDTTRRTPETSALEILAHVSGKYTPTYGAEHDA